MTNDEFRRSFKIPFHSSLGLAVYSCGIQRCGPGHSWGPAVRDHYLIHYITSGKGHFCDGANKYGLSVGDGFLIVPGNIVSYKADSDDPWEYSWVGFNGTDAKQLMEQTGLLNRKPVFHYDKDTKLREQLSEICGCSGCGPSEEALMEAGLLKFLSLLMEQFGAPSEPHEIGYDYVKKAVKYIEYNYSSDITVSDIASSVGISRSHLYRLFMQHISMPPSEYLMRFRISKAATLLEAGNLTAGEAAYSTGFSDRLYFSRVFKKYMGVPPSRYLYGKMSKTGREGQN